MSDKDSMTNKYIRQNRIFADAFNFFIYGGQQIIAADSLKELDTQEIIISHTRETGKKRSRKRTRDLVKMVSVMTNGNTAYMILAVENQSHIHYAMPVRAIMYDSMRYVKQVEEIVAKHEHNGNRHGLSADEFLSGYHKSDTLLPVVTLVIYFGNDEWDGPMSLHDMFQTKDTNLLALVPNYKLNLLAPAFIKDEEFERFHSSLKEVLSFIKYSKDKKKVLELVEKEESFRYVNRDTVEVINAITGANLPIMENEEGMDMCQAIKELMEDAAAEARAEVRAEAIKEKEEKIAITEKSVRMLMDKAGLTLEEALSVLELSENDRKIIMQLL